MLKHGHTTEISSDDRASPLAIDATLNSALGEWKTARTLLTTTIQSYLAACTTVITTCAKPAYRPSERSDLEKILMMIDSELESLVSDENALQDIRMSLVTARNRSTTLVPVNTLPPEILANIFALSDTCFVRNGRSNLHNFTGVCTNWRELAMNTTDVWTHVDVGPDTPQRLTKTLLGRSKNMPIHIHLHEKTRATAAPNRVLGMTETLAPHMHRVCTALLQSTQTLAAAFLDLWLSGGSPSLVKYLMIHQPHGNELFSVDGSTVNALEGQPDNSRAVLQSLSRLHLENIKFDWDSTAYRGLVDLRLNFSRHLAPVICISQLLDILSANPALSILKLSSLDITRPKNWTHPAPIELGCLQVLSLFCIDPSTGLQFLLPAITLTTPSVKVYIGGIDFGYIHHELADFVARCHVAELYCCENYRHPFRTWRSLLELPARILGFRNFFMDEPEEPASQTGASVSQHLWAAGPPRVFFLDCRVMLESLKVLLAECNIHNVRLEQCRVREMSGRDYSGNISMSLCEALPGLRCIVSNTASQEWEDCRMFDR